MRAESELDDVYKVKRAVGEITSRGSSRAFSKNQNEVSTVTLGGFGKPSPRWQGPDVISLGADPEFEVVDSNNTVVDASLVSTLFSCWKHHKHKKYECTNPSECESCNGECPSCVWGTAGTTESRFGLDACGRIIEIRPQASTTARGFKDSVQAVLRDAALQFAYHKKGHTMSCWPMGGKQESIGCHLHFGGPVFANMIGKTRGDKALANAVVASRYLVYDWLSPYCGRARNASNYDIPAQHQSQELLSAMVGVGNSVRQQPHGVEYRELPSCLLTPSLTHAIADILMPVWVLSAQAGETQVELKRSVDTYSAFGISTSAIKRFFAAIQKIDEWATSGVAPSLFDAWDVNPTKEELEEIKVLKTPKKRTKAAGGGRVPCGHCDFCVSEGTVCECGAASAATCTIKD